MEKPLHNLNLRAQLVIKEILDTVRMNDGRYHLANEEDLYLLLLWREDVQEVIKAEGYEISFVTGQMWRSNGPPETIPKSVTIICPAILAKNNIKSKMKQI